MSSRPHRHITPWSLLTWVSHLSRSSLRRNLGSWLLRSDCARSDSTRAHAHHWTRSSSSLAHTSTHRSHSRSRPPDRHISLELPLRFNLSLEDIAFLIFKFLRGFFFDRKMCEISTIRKGSIFNNLRLVSSCISMFMFSALPPAGSTYLSNMVPTAD